MVLYNSWKQQSNLRSVDISLTLRQSLTVIIIAVLTIITDGCKDKPTEPTGDKTPPTVVSSIPTDGTTGFQVDSAITVTFSEPINAGSVSSATFQIDGGIIETYSHSDNTVKLTPASDLAYLTPYTVTLTTGIKDTAGNSLAATHSFGFTTEADPISLPPTVLSTVPANGATGVAVDAPISATFSKGMDSTTLTAASFVLNNGVTGTVTTSGRTATLTPDTNLEYNTTYSAAISEAVADTFGVNLAATKRWSFTTQQDPLSPVVTLTSPSNNEIMGDTVTIAVSVTHPVSIDSVQLWADGAPVSVDLTEPYEFTYGDTTLEIGSIHVLQAKAYDSEGRSGLSGAIGLYYLWEVLAIDDNFEELDLDIRRMLGRTTDSLLELRYEFSAEWGDAVNDTALDMVMYIDADLDPRTGDSTFGDTTLLNGIGADYRILIGIHSNIAFAEWNAATSQWDSVYSLGDFAWMSLPDSASVFQFGIDWADLGDANAVNIVSINAFWLDFDSFVADWIPGQTHGYISIPRQDRYLGEHPVPASPVDMTPAFYVEPAMTSPFDR